MQFYNVWVTSFKYEGARMWDKLDPFFRSVGSAQQFKDIFKWYGRLNVGM